VLRALGANFQELKRFFLARKMKEKTNYLLTPHADAFLMVRTVRLTLSLSEAGLLFNEEVKSPPKKRIQKSELND
jgi:hypothetical protein